MAWKTWSWQKKLWAGLCGVSAGVLANFLYIQRNNMLVAQQKSDEVDDSYLLLGKTAEADDKKHTKNKSPAMPTRNLHGHTSTITFDTKYKKIVPKICKILNQAKEEFGAPGLAFAISHDGNVIVKGGLGLADVENHVPCNSETILRVASISKSLTSLAVGKLMEADLLDLNVPVHKYLPDYPQTTFDGENVDITLQQLLSHTSGIRGYFEAKKGKESKKFDDKAARKRDIQIAKNGDNHKNPKEFHLSTNYANVQDSLQLFQDDPLIYKPGTDYEYSTLAYSVISRVVEKLSNKDFVSYMKNICQDLDMRNTRVDRNDPLIYNRAKYYIRNEKGQLQNVPYVDNSYKWSGGGFLSNVEDIIKFGNAMLMSAQTNEGYLKTSTVSTLWTLEEVSKDNKYALGWQIFFPEIKDSSIMVGHTGGAVGASSIMFMKMDNADLHTKQVDRCTKRPRGSVICIIVNMEAVSLRNTALKIQECLDEMS